MEVPTEVDQVLQRAVDAGDVPGLVAMAADSTGVVYERAFGRRAVDSDAAMTLDSVFWIASMTKAVTSVAAMQQVELGRLQLDQPLGEVLPELDEVQVLEGFDPDGTPRLRAKKRPITLRLLLTHTAGFTYDIWSTDMVRYMEHHQVPGIIECRNATLMTPLLADPGDRWEYGINLDWVGKAVEKVSGMTLQDYLSQHVFEPLGMKGSGFLIRPEQRARMAGMHVRNADGSLTRIDFEITQEPEFHMGGGGLYSEGPDYLRFLQMLLHRGTFNGAQLLRPETVDEMGRNQIGDLSVGLLQTAIPGSSNDAEFFPGMEKKWGLGYMITMEDAPTGRASGSLAWAGLANTFFWIDPARNLCGLFLTQILPFADEKALGLFAEFESGIYQQRPAEAIS